MWEELGISGGTAVIVLIVLYFIIKSAVENGIHAAWEKREHTKEWEEWAKERLTTECGDWAKKHSTANTNDNPL
jgi:hypothetical protein